MGEEGGCSRSLSSSRAEWGKGGEGITEEEGGEGGGISFFPTPHFEFCTHDFSLLRRPKRRLGSETSPKCRSKRECHDAPGIYCTCNSHLKERVRHNSECRWRFPLPSFLTCVLSEHAPEDNQGTSFFLSFSKKIERKGASMEVDGH